MADKPLPKAAEPAKPTHAEILADLARVRAVFQLRTIELILRKG